MLKIKNYKLTIFFILFFGVNISYAQLINRPSATKVAWVPGGEQLFVVNDKHRPLFWNRVMECPIYANKKHNVPILNVLVSDNGRLAVTSDISRKIKLWDVATGAELHEVMGFEHPVSAIEFTKNSRELVLGDWGGEVKQWSLESFSEISRFKAFEAPVFSISIYDPKHLIAVGGANGELLLWDAQFGRILKQFVAHQAPVSQIRFAIDGKYIVSAGDDGRILIWHHDSDSKRYIQLENRPLKIRSLDISPDSQYILVGTETGKIYLIDLRIGNIAYQFQVSDDPLQLVKFTNNFEALLVDKSYRIWDFILATHHLKPVGEISPAAIIPRSMEAFRGEDWTEDKSGMEFVWVDGGCFDIGCDTKSDRNCTKDNMPAKNICVDDYWIAQNEVSSQQWLKVMKQTLPFININLPLLQQDIEENGVLSASGISWYGARDFVCKLNQATQGNFRIPSEAEWEYACEHAIETKKLKQLELDPLWRKKSSVKQKLAEIKRTLFTEKETAPSWQGSVDVRGMHSGVSEWVLDIYNRFGYQYDKRYAPVFLNDDLYYFYNQSTERVKRGGSWDTGISVPECIARQYNFETDEHDLKTGMRLVIPLGLQESLQTPKFIQ